MPNPAHRVAVLRCRDSFSIDPGPIRALYAAQDAKVVEAVVCRALEEIAMRLDRLQLARTSGSFDMIGEPVRRIGAIANGLGLTDVRRVAAAVADAAGSRDAVAVSATMSRLERCFDQAMSAVWDYRQYS